MARYKIIDRSPRFLPVPTPPNTPIPLGLLEARDTANTSVSMPLMSLYTPSAFGCSRAASAFGGRIGAIHEGLFPNYWRGSVIIPRGFKNVNIVVIEL